jgi:sugar phosphate isomerase/epimerase
MKLSFSTLGCPGWTFDEVLARGSAYGFDGVGFRGVAGELDLTKVPEFAEPRLPETRRRLEDAGLVASMILTSARLIVPDAEVEANLALAESHIEIAAALDAPSIRVFGGQFPIGLSHAMAVARAAERLQRLGDFAASRDVVVLLETHDDFTDPALLRRVMEAANHPSVAALWDIHHPYRLLGTPMQTAWDEIGPWVRSIDIKDSITDASARLGYRYVELGAGEIPVAEALRILSANGYDGWLTFEWEKIWHPELAEPEIAFPAFIAAMRRMLAEMR